jgi:hypothetical protein
LVSQFSGQGADGPRNMRADQLNNLLISTGCVIEFIFREANMRFGIIFTRLFPDLGKNDNDMLVY